MHRAYGPIFQCGSLLPTGGARLQSFRVGGSPISAATTANGIPGLSVFTPSSQGLYGYCSLGSKRVRSGEFRDLTLVRSTPSSTQSRRT